jgi:hypothetical protein
MVKRRIQTISIILILNFISSCDKTEITNPANNGNNNNPNSNQPAHMSKRLISRVYGDDSNTDTPYLNYDSTGRLTFFNTFAGTYEVFYKNDTLHHIITPVDPINGFHREGWVFLYNSDKRCNRVLYRTAGSYDEKYVADTDPWWSDESTDDIYDGLHEGSVIDSLIYNTVGQLTEIWEYPEQPNAIVEFKYNSLKDTVPFKINYWWDDDGDSKLDLHYTASLYYTDIDQPGSQQLWFFPFIGFNIPACPNNLGGLSKYTVLLKKAIHNWTFSDRNGNYTESPNYAYGYDSDSTHFNGAVNPFGVEGSFGYEFIKQ